MQQKILDFLTQNLCPMCHIFLLSPHSFITLCDRCRTHLEFHDCVRYLHQDECIPLKVYAPFYYSGIARNLILTFKHSDAQYLTRTLTWYMSESIKQYLSTFDVIVPIPLHWSRLLRRGFNQAVLLALALGKSLDKPVDCRLLKRGHKTKSQKDLSPRQRMRNVDNAFQCQAPKDINHTPRILLIDDVCTSGATLLSAQKTMVQQGYAHVSACVFTTIKYQKEFITVSPEES